jgi:hypothetical protein
VAPAGPGDEAADLPAMTASGVAPIPEGSILLHVGMHKTGTTALQGVLYTLRDQLPALGVSYPYLGDPAQSVAHHIAARSVLQLETGWGETPPDPAKWDEQVALVKASSAPRTILSSEHFAGADDAACQRIAADLGHDRLHVIIGARNFASIAVSLWQQTLKRRRSSTFEEWLERNFRRPEGGSTKFWDRHDPSLVAERWARILGPERVYLLVLDEGDRELVPRTFEELLALPSGTLSSVPPINSNRSMTGVEAELVRRLNVELKKQRRDLTWDLYRSVVRIGAIGQIIEHRRPPAEEPKLQPPAWVVEQARAEAERAVRAVTSGGVNIVGNLANLQPRPPAAGAALESLTQVPSDLAVDALVGAAVLASRRPRQPSGPKRPKGPPAKKSFRTRLRSRLRGHRGPGV